MLVTRNRNLLPRFVQCGRPDTSNELERERAALVEGLLEPDLETCAIRPRPNNSKCGMDALRSVNYLPVPEVYAL